MIEERGVKLPPSDEIIFVKTTGLEEGVDVAAYTHGTQIFIAEIMMDFFKSENQEAHTWSISLLAHELFHCLTRSNLDFRGSMYSIIHFDVQDADYELGPDVTELMITNPDVEHHNSSALFTVNGEQRRCAVVFYAKQPFENPGDTFFDRGGTGLVPVDDLNTLIDSTEVSDFWELFGRNTDYVIDSEEAMADNFSFAVVYGKDGKYYEIPETIDRVLELLTL